MTMFDLTGHVSVVTGGNGGIGLGLATGLARAGAAVAVWARNEAKNRAAADQLRALGGDVHTVAVDVTDAAAVAAAQAETVERFGRVDSLFANAGTAGFVRFETMDMSEWRRVLDVNLTGVMTCAQVVSQHLIERGAGGSLVFVASVAAHRGIGQSPHYSASKGAVLQLARSLAVALARSSIRVNVISPGFVATDMTSAWQGNPRYTELMIDARTPMRRWGTPADFEGPAVFLASEAASSYMTGSEIIVDGGFHVT